MKQKSFVFSLLALTMLSACSSHYRLVSVERTRIVVDSRYDSHPDAEAVALLAPYKHVVDSIMGPVVGEVANDMPVASRPECEISNLLADVLVWAGKAYGEQPVMSVYNMGGIRAPLVKGKVTYGDVLDVAPFENRICFLTLDGTQLLELCREIAATGGEGVSRGVEIVMTPDRKLVSARLHGQAIDPQQSYRIATINYLLEGNDKMYVMREGKDVLAPLDPSNNTRFIIMNYFREQMAQGKKVSSRIEGRIRYVEAERTN